MKLYTERHLPKKKKNEKNGFLSRRIFNERVPKKSFEDKKSLTIDNFYSKKNQLKRVETLDNSKENMISSIPNDEGYDDITHTASKRFLNTDMIAQENAENRNSVKTKKNEKFALTRTLNSLMKRKVRLFEEKSEEIGNITSSKKFSILEKNDAHSDNKAHPSKMYTNLQNMNIRHFGKKKKF